MVNKRRSVQEAHERFTVRTFLDELNRRYRARYKVIAEPNPPEAIISTGRTTRWIEVTTAFMSTAFAKDLYSYATPGEVHQPLGDGVHVGPDARFSENFVSVVKQKLEKSNYESIRDRYGPGYLVVSIQYPLFGRWTAEFMQRAWSEATINDRGCFMSIYHVRRMYRGYKVELWRHA
jgi:hypothetical protein